MIVRYLKAHLPSQLFIVILFLICAADAFATNVSGTISTNTTWNTAGSPYIVVGNITINSGITLTIDADVEVKFDGAYSIISNGIIDAQGTSGNEIVFTSNDGTPARSDWTYLTINASGSIFDYVHIEYAEAVYVNSYSVIFDHVTIENTSQGMLLYGASPTISNSTLANNYYWGIYAEGATIEITDTQITGSPYGIAAVSVTGTIDNVTTSGGNSGLYLSNSSPAVISCTISGYVYGVNALGTSSPVLEANVITGNTHGIFLNLNGSGSVPVISNNSIYSNSNTNLRADYGPAGSLVDAQNNWWGTTDIIAIAAKILDYGDDTELATVDWIPFLDGPGGDPVALEGTYTYGLISTNTTWAEEDTPHILIGNVVVASEATLTIEPGVVAKFEEDFGLTVEGTLEAQGTNEERILFTSNQSSPDAGDWSRIWIKPGAGSANYSYITVEYADYGLHLQAASQGIDNVIVRNNQNYGLFLEGVNATIDQVEARDNTYGIYMLNVTGTTSINNSLLDDNSTGMRLVHALPEVSENVISNNGVGLYVAHNTNGGSSPNISGNEIAGNGTGIQVFGTTTYPSDPVIYNNSFHDNSSLNLYTEADMGVVIDAQNNWWGSIDPWAIMTLIQDKSDNATYTEVDWLPFLDGPGGDPVEGSFIVGDIADDLTLTGTGSPYVVCGNTTVEDGSLLTIDPGVVVKFCLTSSLIIEGTLLAQGTSGNEILFTSNSEVPAESDWDRIRIKNDGSLFSYIILEFSANGIQWDGFPADIDNSVFSNNHIAIWALNVSGTGTISDNTIRHNGSNNYRYGIYLDNASPIITGNLITQSNHGIFIHSNAYGGSSPTITDNQIIYNNNGLFIQGNVTYPSQPVINNNAIFTGGNAYLNGGYDITADAPSGITIDAQNNWWGTVNGTTIENHIYHYNDNASKPLVDFSPYTDDADIITISDTSVSPMGFEATTGGTTSIFYTIDEDADVTMRIYNNAHQLVRTLIDGQSRTSGAHHENWDGKNGLEQIQPDGKYYYTIFAEGASDLQGLFDPLYIPGTVTIDDGDNTGGFNPLKGEGTTIAYDIYQPALITLKVGIYLEQIPLRTIFDSQPLLTTSGTAFWDGRKDNGQFVDDDEYVAALWAYVLPDNLIVLQSTPAAVVESLSADPYVFYPYYDEISTIHYELSESADVTLEVRSPTGSSLVRTLVNNESQSSGSHEAVWDGKNNADKKVASAENYRVRITAIGVSGTAVKETNVTVFE